ncbi:MAG: hypothetical protein ACFWUC_11385 [Oscillospiraceae bacterium]
MVPIYIGTEPSATKLYGITSRTVPTSMAVLLMICGVILLFQSLVLKKDTVKQLVLRQEMLALLYISILIVSLLMFSHSFILAMLFLGFATLISLRCKKVLYYIIEAVTVFALFFIFNKFLHAGLPALFF